MLKTNINYMYNEQLHNLKHTYTGFRFNFVYLFLTIAASLVETQSISNVTAAGVGADGVMTVLSTSVSALNTLIDVCITIYT